MHAPSWHPDIALADLRIRQGRLADAEALLLGKDQAMQALLPAARLHLARGDHDLARATARRGLRVIGDDRLRAVELLTVLVDAELGRGDLAAATAGLRRADRPHRGRRRRRPARPRRRGPRPGPAPRPARCDEAVAALEATVDRVDAGQLPWLRATLLLDLGPASRAGGRRVGRGGRRQGGRRPAGRRSTSCRRGRRSLRSAGRVARRPSLAERTASGGSASCDGTSVRLPTTKGLRYLAELIAHPGAERHALDLVDRVEGVAAGVDRRRAGRRRRGARRPRPDGLPPPHRGAAGRGRRRARGRPAGHGRGRSRPSSTTSSPSSPRRSASAAAIGGRRRPPSGPGSTSPGRCGRRSPSSSRPCPRPAAVLDRRVRTGIYCAYEPADDDEVRWIVQS